MKNINKVSTTLNWLLGIIYIPLSFFSWMLQMASEGTIDATNSTYIGLINVFCFIAFIIPLLCVMGIVISVILRKRRHYISSLIIQFLPLLVFIGNLILLAFAESLPAMQ